MSEHNEEIYLKRIRSAFAKSGINLISLTVRQFPNETIFIAEVSSEAFTKAVSLASDLDSQIENGFVSVRKAVDTPSNSKLEAVKSLVDTRVSDLVDLLTARSQTSEQQPSLRYLPDANQNLNVVRSRRHNLIFGRRGVGKTALMLEARRIVEETGSIAFWMNIQSVRQLNANDSFLTLVSRFFDLLIVTHANRSKKPRSVEIARELQARAREFLSSPKLDRRDIGLLISEVQDVVKLFTSETQADIYFFLDDMHYLAMKEQPQFLDMLHSITRDNAAWIKASGIRHQSRWFTDDPPTGLQTGHDATLVDLDITLEQPAKAREFLTGIIQSYLQEVRLGNVRGVISGAAIDRLVLASGGVPRDFLNLSAMAILVGRGRHGAKTAGVQDVNESAGQYAKPKLQELDEDAASSLGKAESRREILGKVRSFLLEDRQTTYMRVDFLSKERFAVEYESLQSIMDMRLIHLIHSSLSDEREAGRRSEVYMLDLSQYSGTRFKRSLNVLDLVGDYLTLKVTGGTVPPRLGDTPKKLLNILRRGPAFDLSELTPFVRTA